MVPQYKTRPEGRCNGAGGCDNFRAGAAPSDMRHTYDSGCSSWACDGAHPATQLGNRVALVGGDIEGIMDGCSEVPAKLMSLICGEWAFTHACKDVQLLEPATQQAGSTLTGGALNPERHSLDLWASGGDAACLHDRASASGFTAPKPHITATAVAAYGSIGTPDSSSVSQHTCMAAHEAQGATLVVQRSRS